MSGTEILKAALAKHEAKERDAKAEMVNALRGGTRRDREAAESAVARTAADAGCIRRAIALVQAASE